MNKEELIKKLKRPKGFFLFLVYFFAFAFGGVSVYLAVRGEAEGLLGLLSYPVYALAALFLSYGVYAAVIYFPLLKGKCESFLKSNELAGKIAYNYDFKTLVFSSCSFAVTVAFAIMNLVSAFLYGLLWYAAIAAYYFILIAYRGGIILFDLKRRKKKAEQGDCYELGSWLAYRSGGSVFLLLEVAMGLAVTETVLLRRPIRTGEIMAIANAAYAFYKMSMAIYNLVKSKKHNNPVVQALRNVNFADACMSMVSLTVILLTTFGEGSDLMVIKALVGFSACAAIAYIAIAMIARSSKQIKIIRERMKNNG